MSPTLLDAVNARVVICSSSATCEDEIHPELREVMPHLGLRAPGGGSGLASA